MTSPIARADAHHVMVKLGTRFAGNSLGRCMTFGYLPGRELAGLE